MLDSRMVGSTFIGLLIYKQIGIVFWMGDSRLYRYRGGKISQLTLDHSHVEELLKAGEITKEEAENHPESNVITRAVGTSNEAYLDIDIIDVQLGDIYMLCSDGLYNAVDIDEIKCGLDMTEPDKIVSQLIENSLDNGATDNVSVVIIKGINQPTN